MSVIIVENKIALPQRMNAVSAAVLKGIGNRPDDEEWRITIFEPIDSPRFTITIHGPHDFTWKRTFLDPKEQTFEFIRREVRNSTRFPSRNLLGP